MVEHAVRRGAMFDVAPYHAKESGTPVKASI
jgi:hypothetical protein